MLRFYYIILLFSFAFLQNSCPIILIHGFLGWGRNEMAGYFYWGGRMDYEQELRSAGFDVYTVSVGPISTNWDRAVETFYQIKGGQVDYGYERANQLGFIQKPDNKKYQGLYPAWDENHPVHIISHSQGGQTARMLETLLKKRFLFEDSPLLSKSYNGWIKSITTISTPHNGSTLVPIMLDVFPFSLSLAPWVGSVDSKIINNFYSFDLDHWGLKRYSGESFESFVSRISQSSLANTKNLCSWELSPAGAEEFNKNYVEDESVYYFSFSTTATKQKNGLLYHIPDSAMSFHLWPTAMLIGSYDQAADSTWYENDGVVNTVSMSHPFGSKIITADQTTIKGVWQFLGNLHMDHQSVVGHGVSKKENRNIFAVYNKHCTFLSSLK